jgi:hypothetical protein
MNSYIINYLLSLTGVGHLIIAVLILLIQYRYSYTLKKFIIFLIYAFVSLSLGLRSNSSGRDTQGYVTSFSFIEVGGYSGYDPTWELLYNLLSHSISILELGSIFLLVNVLIQLVLVHASAIYVGIKNTPLTLFMYISLMPGFDMLTNGMRQGISVPIGLFISLIILSNRIYFPISALYFILHKSLLYNLLIAALTMLQHKYYITVARFLLLVSVLLMVMWQFVDASSYVSGFVQLIDLQLNESAQTVGQKASSYLLTQNDLLSPIIRLYFVIIYVAFVLSAYYISFKTQVDDGKLLLIVAALSLPYALLYDGSYSYRFLYMFYLPALLYLLLSFENSKIKWALLLISILFGVLTYGSNTYRSFEHL